MQVLGRGCDMYSLIAQSIIFDGNDGVTFHETSRIDLP